MSGLPRKVLFAVQGGKEGAMFDETELKNNYTFEEKLLMKREIGELGERFEVLQQQIKKAGIPVIIVFEGWSASGKGSLIGKLLKFLDPRGVKMYSISEASDEEKRKPYMNRFWMRIPGRGEIAIFDRSWYHEWMINEKPAHENEIKTFERQLTDDGYVIFKFFLHISKKEQEERLDELEESKATAWRVKKHDRSQNKRYAKCRSAYDAMLEATDYEYAKWQTVSGMDKDAALREVLSCVVKKLEKLSAKVLKNGPQVMQKTGILPDKMMFEYENKPPIETVNLDCMLSEKEYHKRLDKLQDKLLKLSYKLYKKGIPLIICYEGWDAAGKGGNIKRLVSCFDARDYEVHPVAAPDSYEKVRHYLWRFQKNIPKTGHIAVFDRTWYGRVMVERIEGFNTETEWKRAYNEINEFEKELSDWGAVIVKFWLQIDKDEQLARFKERENTPSKQWKITEEDWRNREKWDEYETAVNEMLRYTSTQYAPWHIIESNNKYYARIKAIETVVDAVSAALENV